MLPNLATTKLLHSLNVRPLSN